MTREELNAVRGYVSNIQAIKDAHNTEQLPINYGTICTITANGWKLIEELKALEQEPCVTIKNLSDEEIKHFAEEMKKARLQVIQQEHCEDCVSRESMLEYQQYLHGKMSNEENHKLWEFIKALPSVTPNCGKEIEVTE